MHVTKVAAIPVEIGIKPRSEEFGVAPYVSGYMSQETTRRLVIRVETDEGIVGWGETTWGPGPSVAVPIVEDVIADEIVGEEVWAISNLLETFEYPYTRITPYVGGVEMALWDAFGKYLGEPIHKFFGGKQVEEVPVACCLGIVDPEESAEYARWARDQGFGLLKTKGGRDPDEDVERVAAMAEAVDGDLQFRLDGNQTVGFEDAVRVGAKLEDRGVYLQYYEQPLRIDNVGGYKRLRQRLRTPIAVNEDAYHARNLFQLVREDAIDVAVIDMVPMGGLLAASRGLGLVDDAGISVAHHSSFDLGIKTAAVLQFTAASPAVNLPPDRVNFTLEDDVVVDPIGVDAGAMAVPDDPGLGVSVSEDDVARYAVSEGEGFKYESSP